jgi:hypothetical protein
VENARLRTRTQVTVRDIIERHPRPVMLDADLLEQCIEDCIDCAATCTACADACLGEPDVVDLLRSIRLNLDCTDVCEGVGRVLTRQTEPDLRVVRGVTEACVVACRVCAAECEKHAAHHDHCRVCAEVCRRCEQRCFELLAVVSDV